jgi:hypothetical protein
MGLKKIVDMFAYSSSSPEQPVLTLQENMLFAAATCAAKHQSYSHLMTVAQGLYFV